MKVEDIAKRVAAGKEMEECGECGMTWEKGKPEKHAADCPLKGREEWSGFEFN